MEINLKIISLGGTNDIWGAGHGLKIVQTNQIQNEATLLQL